jgi:hypothetical protein
MAHFKRVLTARVTDEFVSLIALDISRPWPQFV